MKHLALIWTCVISLILPTHGEEAEAKLHIEKCNSGVDYPTKGDESVDVRYGDHIYHLRIYHPKAAGESGPHFSTPIFWTSKHGDKHSAGHFLVLKTHLGGLSWHSIRGYFFAEKAGKLRGYFIEDGFDNADNGSSGLILLQDDGGESAWSWTYVRDPKKTKGTYRITSAEDPKQKAPEALLRRISEVLNLAEKEADAWPGP